MKGSIFWIIIVLLLICVSYVTKVYINVANTTHYHANVAIYIHWQRLDLSDDKYMEDISSCKKESDITPEDRVHFHENNMDVVHIHHQWVTWGHLMANIWLNFWKDFFADDKGNLYRNDDMNQVMYVLNGKRVLNPFNSHIQSEDRLLINYGNQSKDYIIWHLSTKVWDNAKEFNGKYDPGSCWNDTHNGVVKNVVQSLLKSSASKEVSSEKHNHDSTNTH